MIGTGEAHVVWAIDASVPLELVLTFIIRYLHIACAIIAIGGPFFVRFGLMPAAGKTLDAEAHQKLRETINHRWRIVVYCVITLFILTGLYLFLVPVKANGVLISSRWREMAEADKKMYHMIFGIKMLGAFALFFLASALAGRTATFAPLRKKAKLFVSLFLGIAALVLLCAEILRSLP